MGSPLLTRFLGAAGGAALSIGASGCDRRSDIERALPSSATDVRAISTPAEGSPEGDYTFEVEARFPDPAACQAFIDGYGPRAGLAPGPSRSWARDDLGRESFTLSCSGAEMKWVDIKY